MLFRLDIIFAIMCDIHKTPRLYISGAEKRKLAEQRLRKEVEILSKVPKISECFISSNQSITITS